MLHTEKVIVVEGKYDAIKLANLIDATILRTDGFGIFKNKEKQKMLRTLAEKRGLIVLTDGDSAGFLIRNFIKSAIPEKYITNVYVPDIYGKEKRKARSSAEGKLGVEGIPDDVLIDCFKRAGIGETEETIQRRDITAADFYDYGLNGRPGSADARQRLQKELGLPSRMTGKQLLRVINMLMTYDEFVTLMQSPDALVIDLPRPVATAISALEAAGFEAYAVGGCVRDSLLGRNPNDWDITTSALPEETEGVFRGERIIETGLQHGTVTVLLNGMPLEITTYRIEGTYADSRHPDCISFTRSLEEDLKRRDFTVNTLCYSPRTGLVDLCGGVRDLEDHIIRCVGDPVKRFTEDALRILRAIRFSSTLGFSVEEGTARAVHAERERIRYVSQERIAVELKKLLAGEDPAGVLREYADVVGVILPELKPCMGFDQHNYHHKYDVYEHILQTLQYVPQDPVLRMTMLLHDIAKPRCFSLDENGVGHFYHHASIGAETADEILRRLRFSNEERETIVTLVRYHDGPLDPDPKRIRKKIGKLGERTVRDLAAVQRADRLGQGTKDPQEIEEEYRTILGAVDREVEQGSAFSVSDLAVSGRDVIEAGVPQGPEIGRVLQSLLTQVQNETIENTREALLAALKGELHGNGSGRRQN